MRPVRMMGDEQAEVALALSATRSPTFAVLGMTLSERPGTMPVDARVRLAIHARAPAILGASSRASVARSFASSARVRSSDARVRDCDVASEVPASRLNVPVSGVTLATAVAPTPLAWNVTDARDAPSSAELNGTSAKSPPAVPPDTHTDVAAMPAMT